MRKTQKNDSLSRGDTLVTVLLGLVIAGGIGFALNTFILSSKKGTAKIAQRVLTDFYVAELLEYFRALPAVKVLEKTFAYPRCAHINILDRAHGNIVNGDSLATLPATWLDSAQSLNADGTTFYRAPNRFYQVFIVDMQTMVLDPSCEGSPPTPPFNLITALAPLSGSKKLLVTVGVSWVPINAGKDGNFSNDDVETTVGSVLIPGS